MSNKTRCECPLAGYCERHGVKKNEALHRLCRENPEFFQAWEECRGPKQTEECIPSKSRGLGDTVAKVAKNVGLDKVAKAVARVLGSSGGCGCNKRQKRLNELVPYNTENKDGDN